MRLKEIKAAVLKKGWAGRTLSREATTERLCPIINAHMALNHGYNHAAAHYPAPDVKRELTRLQKAARTDVGKLLEVVFSCGGVPPNGTDMEPEDFALPADGMLEALRAREESFQDLLRDEKIIEHQIRTEAVITHLLVSSQSRLTYLRGAIRQAPRTSTA